MATPCTRAPLRGLTAVWRRFSLGVASSGALVLLIAVGTSSCGPKTEAVATSADALVVSAARATLSKNTAKLSITGTVDAGGQAIAIHGSGAEDVSAGTCSMDIGFTLSGISLSEKVVQVNAHAYLDATVNGSDVLDGKWAQYPATYAAQSTQDNPLSALRLLSAKGAHARAVAEKQLDGQTARGYVVSIPRGQMVEDADSELARASLSRAEIAAAEQAVTSLPAPTYTIWVGRSDLLLEINIHMALTTLGKVDLRVDMTNFGLPVSIVAPSPANVISYQRFEQVLSDQFL